jgi:hypothetical protein
MIPLFSQLNVDREMKYSDSVKNPIQPGHFYHTVANMTIIVETNEIGSLIHPNSNPMYDNRPPVLPHCCSIYVDSVPVKP